MKLPIEGFERYIVVVTGMSYIIDSSGTSKAVKAHEDIFKRNGIGYIAVFPISKSIGTGSDLTVKMTGCYALVVDGHFISVVTAIDVLNFLVKLQDAGKHCVGVLIHHIIRNDIAEVQWLLEKIQNVPVYYYLHDFYTCCNNPNLLRNDMEFCAEKSDGDICEGCVYAEGRQQHLKKIKSFLDSFGDRLRFIAPSNYMQETWSAYYPAYADRVLTIPHLKSIGSYEGNKAPVPDKDAMRIGFVGAQTYAKGWEIFKHTVAKLQDSHCNYKFYYFGHSQEHLPDVTDVPVEIAKMGKDAMINAIREHQISAVFLVCVWGETYSYTMYESHAANSYILTMSKSGNIAYTVKKENWGGIFETEDDLMATLLDEQHFRNTVNNWKIRAEPGAAAYEDNDEIVSLFPETSDDRIVWKKREVSLIQKGKRTLLNWLFVNLRLNRK